MYVSGCDDHYATPPGPSLGTIYVEVDSGRHGNKIKKIFYSIDLYKPHRRIKNRWLISAPPFKTTNSLFNSYPASALQINLLCKNSVGPFLAQLMAAF
jgi:hypothetical protein